MLRKSLIAGVITGLMLFIVVVACSQQKDSKVKIPSNVKQAVIKAVPGGEITGCKRETEDGKELFEVIVKKDNSSYELAVSPSGEILDKEETTNEGEITAVENDENEEAIVFSFDNNKIGVLPQGWSSSKTGKGDPGVWMVLEDSTAPSKPNVLAQTSKKNFGYHFNIAVAEQTHFSDLEIKLKFKAVDGQEDQGGGPVWRYHDPDNYYICRANPLESNFRVYKVVNGNRRQMQSARIEIPANMWHSIKVKNIGNNIKCWLNGKLYLNVTDDTFKSGKVGLWTKADAVTYFDNFEINQEESESE